MSNKTKKTVADLIPGDTVVVSFGDSIQYKKIGTVRRVTTTQLIVTEEGSAREERYYRTGHRAGRRYGAHASTRLEIMSPDELTELRRAKQEMKDNREKRDAELDKISNYPENRIVQRICNATDETWKKLTLDELRQVERYLYGECADPLPERPTELEKERAKTSAP